LWVGFLAGGFRVGFLAGVFWRTPFDPRPNMSQKKGAKAPFFICGKVQPH